MNLYITKNDYILLIKYFFNKLSAFCCSENADTLVGLCAAFIKRLQKMHILNEQQNAINSYVKHKLILLFF